MLDRWSIQWRVSQSRRRRSCFRSHGFVVGHVVPEAQVGGPIALVQDGDIITIDAEANTLDVNVSEEEFARRKSNWVAPPLRPKQGALLKYARNVTDASRGCGEWSLMMRLLSY